MSETTVAEREEWRSKGHMNEFGLQILRDLEAAEQRTAELASLLRLARSELHQGYSTQNLMDNIDAALKEI